jgi:hypothetical protein
MRSFITCMYDKMKVGEMGGACSTYGMRNAYTTITLVGKREGKRPLGRHRRRWECNIRMYLREIGWEGLDWIHLAQDRDKWQVLVNAVMKLRVL